MQQADIDTSPGGLETEPGRRVGGWVGKGVNGREGPLESCHVTPEPIWVNGLVETNDAAPPPPTQRKSFTSGLTEEL